MFEHQIIFHSDLHVSYFSKPSFTKNLLFIHGGPGFNNGVLEYLIKNEKLFASANFNLVLYDQRGCGKSNSESLEIRHQDNLTDLKELIEYLLKFGIQIDGLIGHSYGAKLLYDLYCVSKIKLPGIFVGIAKSMLTPRINNFISDLNYLKKIDAAQYKKIFNQLQGDVTLNQLWTLTQELSSVFVKNEDRPFNMWANLNWMVKVTEIQKKINLPINQKVLISVREDIYADEAYCKVDIPSLDVPFLWINGFHDYIMSGAHDLFNNEPINVFSQSSHYPHIEENEKFCELLNDFI